jgi:hypothetical protein
MGPAVDDDAWGMIVLELVGAAEEAVMLDVEVVEVPRLNGSGYFMKLQAYA